MKNFRLAQNFFLKSAEHPTVCFFWAKRCCFHSLFSNGTLLTMENFPWQLIDYGKFSMEKKFSPEKPFSGFFLHLKQKILTRKYTDKTGTIGTQILTIHCTIAHDRSYQPHYMPLHDQDQATKGKSAEAKANAAKAAKAKTKANTLDDHLP